MVEVADHPPPRALEPFSFFVDQSSALVGFGGSRRHPDPRYCFHTPYGEHRPGIVLFSVRLIGARARFGEMTVRIHGFRPDSNMDAVLVAAKRLPLENLVGEDAEISVRIAAIPGVQYAAYGYLSEPSDLEIRGLQISAQDLGGNEDDSFAATELGQTRFGAEPLARLGQLVGERTPEFHQPLSQPFTAGQVRSTAFAETIAQLNERSFDDERHLWRYAFALHTLAVYGFLEPGARGLLLGAGAPLVPALSASGVQVVQHGTAAATEGNDYGQIVERVDVPLTELPASILHCDFAVSLGTLDDASSDQDMRDRLSNVLKCLQRGGLGVFLFDYWPNSWGAPPDAPFVPTETSITRLALYVIGHGSGIAQLLLPTDLPGESRGMRGRPYGMIVKR